MRQELLTAVLVPETLSEESRTINLVFYTGVSVPRVDLWNGGEIYDLAFSMNPGDVDLTRLNSGAPLLNSHQRENLSSQIGVVLRAWIENGTGKATVKFSEREDVQPIWNDVKAGIIRNISMGAFPHKYANVTPKGQKRKSILVTKWEPQELSVLPVPADSGAQFLAAHKGSPADLQELLERLMHDRSLQDLAVTGAAGHAEEPNFRLELAKHKQRQREYSI